MFCNILPRVRALLPRSPPPHAPLHASRVASTSLLAATAGVDNLLAASSVKQRLAAGAAPLRIEADFVTCSQ